MKTIQHAFEVFFGSSLLCCRHHEFIGSKSHTYLIGPYGHFLTETTVCIVGPYGVFIRQLPALGHRALIGSIPSLVCHQRLAGRDCPCAPLDNT